MRPFKHVFHFVVELLPTNVNVSLSLHSMYPAPKWGSCEEGQKENFDFGGRQYHEAIFLADQGILEENEVTKQYSNRSK